MCDMSNINPHQRRVPLDGRLIIPLCNRARPRAHHFAASARYTVSRGNTTRVAIVRQRVAYNLERVRARISVV